LQVVESRCDEETATLVKEELPLQSPVGDSIVLEEPEVQSNDKKQEETEPTPIR
jgi:hypothetical protein